MSKIIDIKCPKCGRGVIDTYAAIRVTAEWRDGELQAGMRLDAERIIMPGTKAGCSSCQFSGWIEDFQVKDDECGFCGDYDKSIGCRDKECPKEGE